jgi:heme oxygenase (mycobilin-producing)
MKITRIFRVRIAPARREEFETKFTSISMPSVTQAKGVISVSIHKPTKWAPDEYAMFSQWEDEAALAAFAGEDWSRPKIPRGMESLVEECWVHHYRSWSG